MKLIKIAALLTSAAVLMAAVTGCSQAAKSPLVSSSPSPSPEVSAAAVSAQKETLDLESAYKSLDAKTVMMIVDGKDVTWGEMFYYINLAINQFQQNVGEIKDWTAIYKDNQTYSAYVLDGAAKMALEKAAIEAGAAQLKVTVTAEDQATLQANWDAQVKTAGSEEAALKQLTAQYCTKDLYTSLQQVSALAQECFTASYGEKGSKLSDQDVADYTEKDTYYMAKHILMLTKNTDESGNQSDMTDAQKAVVKEKMQKILDQLKAYKGNDFDSYFNQLMTESSEDKGGLASFPDGYLFQPSDMVAEFENATKALQIGSFTQDLVETTYGYHIIYRIPVNYDKTPAKYANSGEYSLRFLTAYNMFAAQVDTWQQNVKVTYSDQYKALDFTKLLPIKQS